MLWWQIFLIVLAVVALVAGLCIGAFYLFESLTNKSGGAPQINNVEARGFQFVPEEITVKKGTKVCWNNLLSSFLKHNVVQIEGDACDAAVSKNGFTSGSPGQVDQYCHIFDTPGTYYYKCVPHCKSFFLAMKGKIVVTE